MSDFKIFIGNIISPISDHYANYFPDSCLLAKRQANSNEYLISEIFESRHLRQKTKSLNNYEIHDFTGKLISPTFCDIHFHWVQDEVREMKKDDLLEWLKNHTWPAEALFESEEYTFKKAKSFAQSLLKSGTLSGAVYGSIHDHSVELAFDSFPGDFIVGNVLMTMNSPASLLQSKQDALSSVSKLGNKYKSRYAITPRFAITTHPDVMEASSKIAQDHDCFIQTHLCETKQEIEFVLDLYSKIPGFEKVKTYTEIYEKCGILGPKSILGHGIYLTNDELKMLKDSSSSIAHCPSSNAPVAQKGLGSGLFDIDLINKHDISWALASDIGAGPYLSMIDVMNSFISQHRTVGRKNVSWTMALYRSTLAGEKICDNHLQRGNFEVGKQANLIVIDSGKINKSWDAEVVLRHCFEISYSNRSQVDEKIQSVFWNGNLLTT